MPDPASRPVTGNPWGAVAPEGADTALGLAARLGGYCWAEQQLFALLGAWALDIAEPDVKLMVAEHAGHAAWRARLWHDLLPTAPPGPGALVVGPAAVVSALERLPEAIGAPEGDEGAPLPDTVARLAAAYRVLLPRLAAALRAHLDWTTPVVEPEVGRVLGVCAADIAADWVAGERMLQTLVSGGPELERAHSVAQRLDTQLAAAGGLLGPASTGLRSFGGAT